MPKSEPPLTPGARAANYSLQDHIVGGWIPTPDPEDEDDPVDETVVYLVSDGQCHDMPYGPGRLWRGFRNAVTHRQPEMDNAAKHGCGGRNMCNVHFFAPKSTVDAIKRSLDQGLARIIHGSTQKLHIAAFDNQPKSMLL